MGIPLIPAALLCADIKYTSALNFINQQLILRFSALQLKTFALAPRPQINDKSPLSALNLHFEKSIVWWKQTFFVSIEKIVIELQPRC